MCEKVHRARNSRQREIVVDRSVELARFIFFRMYWLCLVALAVTATAQNAYDLDGRVPFPGKSSSLGPLYASAGQGFRDNSYEDNIVTPTPTPAFRNPGQQPVSNEIIIIVVVVATCTPIGRNRTRYATTIA